MTTPLMSAAMCGQALTALDLVDAFNEKNVINIANITETTRPEELIRGLVLLASGFRSGFAAAAGCSVDELSEQTRAMYLLEAAGVNE